MKHSCERQKQSFFFFFIRTACAVNLFYFECCFSFKKTNKKKQYLSFESKTARYKRYLFNFYKLINKIIIMMMKEHRFAPRSPGIFHPCLSFNSSRCPSLELDHNAQTNKVETVQRWSQTPQTGHPPPPPPSSSSSAAWREAQVCEAPTPSNIQQISISRGPGIPHQPSATSQHSSGGPPRDAVTKGSCVPQHTNSAHRRGCS